jgi:L-amino acid N-acyltransferase YncA
VADALVIRDWAPADAAACAAIYAPWVIGSTASFELIAPDAGEIARRFTTLRETGYPVLVAQREGRVAGYAYAGVFRARAAYRHTVEHSVYVDHAAQGRGIGRRLLEALVAECAARGFRRMVGVVADPVQARSVDFHRALGFVEAGVLRGVGRKFDRDLDILLLQRELP